MRTRAILGASTPLAGLALIALAMPACHRSQAEAKTKETGATESLSTKTKEPAPAPAPAYDADLSMVTPVKGPGWIVGYLKDKIENSPLGHQGGTEVAAATDVKPGVDGFVVSGADIYRVSCRSCHGPRAEGDMPVIPGIVSTISGTSKALLSAQLEKQMGKPPAPAMVAQITQMSKQNILKRMHAGGEKMPPFAHLQPKEIEAVLAYVRSLAGEKPKHPLRIHESTARMGELIVQGTCHTCHPATGPGAHELVMKKDIVPSLATIPDRPLEMVTQKVHTGNVSETGAEKRKFKNRMPAFPYLSNQEIAAAYKYLAENVAPEQGASSPDEKAK